MAVRIKHGTTTAATVFTVTLSAYYSQVQVFNRGGDDLYVSMDGVTNPTVGGDDFFVVPQNTTGQLYNLAAQPSQWEQGADYDINVPGSYNTGNGQTVVLSQSISWSMPVGTVFTFTGGGTLTLTTKAQNGDTALVGNVAVATITGVGDLTQPSSTTVLLISTNAAKLTVEGIAD